ncbi:MAG: alpha-amylase family glycosyl hydrolase [Lachnospiraceae bacterium]
MNKALNIQKASPYPLGVRRNGMKLTVSFVSKQDDCGICLYPEKGSVLEPLNITFPKDFKTGTLFHLSIDGIPSSYRLYSFYEGDENRLDLHALCYEKHAYASPIIEDELLAVIPSTKFEWKDDSNPHISYEDAVFYGLHVRGFTKHASSKTRYKGTFLGIIDKLDYLKDLGVTSIMLMPAYEFIEHKVSSVTKKDCYEPILDYQQKDKLLNVWGYTKGYYYAPKASYAYTKDPVKEFKELVKETHARGMELVMQFYISEGVLEPQIVDILEHWVLEYHVDGFQLIGAQVNTNMILSSPILTDIKFIYHSLEDEGMDCFSKSISNKKKAVMHEDTLVAYRRFLKGDEYSLDGLLYHFRKSGKNIAHLNYIADYAGFRVADMVSYDYKHNEVNGEKNKDGSNYNYSWNCGEEGPSKKKSIQKLRLQQMKNAFSLILLSQGTPFIFMGDEMGRTQNGNNNPYNQDNELNYVNWKDLNSNKTLYDFVKELIAYRKAHPILHMPSYLNGLDFLGCGIPNISFHGLEAFEAFTEGYRREQAILLCGDYAKNLDGTCDNSIYILFNMHWEEHTFALPKLPKKASWELAVSTNTDASIVCSKRSMKVPARTIIVLQSK